MVCGVLAVMVLFSGLLSVSASAASKVSGIEWLEKNLKSERLSAVKSDASDPWAQDLISSYPWIKPTLTELGAPISDTFISPDGFVYFFHRLENRLQQGRTPEGRLSSDLGVDVYRVLPGQGQWAPEKFATGLRRPSSLVFDALGHPFVFDVGWKDSGSCRWLHLVDGADFGWRASINGDGGSFSDPNEAHWLACQTSPLGGYVLAPIASMPFEPIDMVAHPVDGWSLEAPQVYFFTGFFHGGYRLETFVNHPLEISFDVVRRTTLARLSAPMSISLDLKNGWKLWSVPGMDKAPSSRESYRLFDPRQEHAPESVRTQQLLETDPADLPTMAILPWLDHADRRIRMKAQFALADRGGQVLDALMQRARNPIRLIGRMHALWAIRLMNHRFPELLKTSAWASLRETLLTDPSPSVRIAALELCGRIGFSSRDQLLMHALSDKDAGVRLQAMTLLGRLDLKPPVKMVLDWLVQPENQQQTMRHAAMRVLANSMTASDLEGLTGHENYPVRLAAVHALRWKKHPGVRHFLQDAHPVIILEAALAIFGESMDQALPALAEMHGSRAQWMPAFETMDPGHAEGGVLDGMLQCVYAANAKLGQPTHFQALAEAVETKRYGIPFRTHCTQWLLDWLDRKAAETEIGTTSLNTPVTHESMDAVWNVRVKDWIRADLDVQRRFMLNYIRWRNWRHHTPMVERIFRAFNENHDSRALALRTLADWNVANLSGLIGEALISNSAMLRKEAVLVQAQLHPSDQVAEWVRQLEKGTLADQKHALQELGASRDRRVDSVLLFWLDQALEGNVPPELHEVLQQAAQQRTPPVLQQKLKDWKAGKK